MSRGDAQAVADLVERSQSIGFNDVFELANELRAEGWSPDTVCELVQMAARRLGDLWTEDHLSESGVSRSIGALQLLVRRLGPELQMTSQGFHPTRTALVAMQPNEQHLLELALLSEYFTRDGWDVECAFPRSDAELVSQVRDHRFDVFALCLSGAFERRERLRAMGTSIAAVRGASQNERLTVLASGRAFALHPELSVLVGADASVRMAADASSLAGRLLAVGGLDARNESMRTLCEVGGGIAQRASQKQLAGYEGPRPRDH